MIIKIDELSDNVVNRVHSIISESKIVQMQECLKKGETFPPIIVFNDNGIYHLVDGLYRVRACQRSGIKTVESDIREGTESDAFWAAIGLSNKPGRIKGEMANSVRLALEYCKGKNFSEIARQVGCSGVNVSQIGSKRNRERRVLKKERGTYEAWRKFKTSYKEVEKIISNMSIMIVDGQHKIPARTLCESLSDKINKITQKIME